ncbi:MAG: RNA polymerase sigma factor [Pirellulaceae bacterium]|jgi:RNA polymerase sigma-70 factor (ECF subfamily)|nr:RNA polymerase sigma factor [Pirellulaceae bacterium]MDP7015228.1 RNA polymerase sigma factor [Pirellulaceae bacterium]
MSENPQQTDGAVVAHVLSGDTERFAELVRRYQPSLLRAAVNQLGQRDAAEDAVQEAFLCAFKSLATYDSRFSFRTWLWTILLNQCRRQYQKRMRPQAKAESAGSVSHLEEATSRDLTPAANLLVKERRQLLEQQMGALPAPLSDALRLRFFGGLKYQEIAHSMGCSLSTAKNRVRWGLERLSQMNTESPRSRSAKPSRPARVER